jgi:hypothetical protein
MEFDNRKQRVPLPPYKQEDREWQERNMKYYQAKTGNRPSAFVEALTKSNTRHPEPLATGQLALRKCFFDDIKEAVKDSDIYLMSENRRDSRAHMAGERHMMYNGLPESTTYTEYPHGANPPSKLKTLYRKDLRGPVKWRTSLETTDPERMSQHDEWAKDVMDALLLMPNAYPPENLVEETSRRKVATTVWFRKLPDLGESQATWLMGTLAGLLPWGNHGILAMCLPRIQHGEILTGSAFVRYATPKLADLACMRMHGLAVIYENYKSPYDLEADENDMKEDPYSKLPDTAWFRTVIEAGLSQTETVVGKYLGSRDRETPIGGTKILENVWKILPAPHGTLRHSKMYMDTSTRIHQKWRFTYPDPSWFEATGRDSDLDTVILDESWPPVDRDGYAIGS